MIPYFRKFFLTTLPQDSHIEHHYLKYLLCLKQPWNILFRMAHKFQSFDVLGIQLHLEQMPYKYKPNHKQTTATVVL